MVVVSINEKIINPIDYRKLCEHYKDLNFDIWSEEMFDSAYAHTNCLHQEPRVCLRMFLYRKMKENNRGL